VPHLRYIIAGTNGLSSRHFPTRLLWAMGTTFTFSVAEYTADSAYL